MAETERTCCSCGRTDPPGGLRLTDDLDRWTCRRTQECIKAMTFEPDLHSTIPDLRRQAIDADYERKGR